MVNTMNSTERVRNTILGKPVDRQPIYGWVFANLTEQISKEWGSVEAFEDAYEFDMAHIFGGIVGGVVGFTLNKKSKYGI